METNLACFNSEMLQIHFDLTIFSSFTLHVNIKCNEINFIIKLYGNYIMKTNIVANDLLLLILLLIYS